MASKETDVKTDVVMNERKQLSDHLADTHGVWLTRQEFKRSDLAALKVLHDKAHGDG